MDFVHHYCLHIGPLLIIERPQSLGCTERLRPQTKGTPFRLQTAFAAFANVHGVVWHLQTSPKNKDFFVCKFVCKFLRSKNSPKKRAYGTPDSHVVPHRSTDEACSGLTAQFGRDTVRFTEYGRRHPPQPIHAYVYRCVPRYFHFNRRRARRRRAICRARARRAGRDGRAETHKNGHSARDDARNICPSALDRENEGPQSSVRSCQTSSGRRSVARRWR